MTQPLAAERRGVEARARVPAIAYGGDYNPEQWPRDVWLEDARLMKEAGVNLVTLGVFAWALLEPVDGVYEFGWLDDVMDLLHTHGVFVNLATATVCPPAWLVHAFPDIRPVDEGGATVAFGGRQHFCPSSSIYRAKAVALAQELALRYGDHPALVLWHVGNEYGNEVPECYCPTSAEHFRHWLRVRYSGDVGALNDAWGTTFWGQRYGDWEEIGLPLPTPAPRNPAQQLDFHRFNSEAMLECFRAECDVLRRITPDVPVTTNFMSFFKPLDYRRWAAEEDVVSLNSYPDVHDPDAHIKAALNFDLMRSLGRGRPWLLMEQAPSAAVWRRRNSTKPAGLTQLWSHQAVARGADAVMFFQWRASRFGAEKFHSAMLPHAGTATRVWREVRELGRRLQALGKLAGSRLVADTALVWDWESWWALELDARPSADVRLVDQLVSYYSPLWRANVSVDVVHPEDELGAYRFVVVPNLYLVSDRAIANIERFVAAGGHLVMSFFSGVVDEHDRVRSGAYPGAFRDLLGLSIEEFNPLQPGESVQVRLADGSLASGSLWLDVLELAGADALAAYTEGEYLGIPAVTRHDYGRGVVTYFGTQLEDRALASLLLGAASAAGVKPTAHAPAGVEATRRQGAGSFLFLLNHAAAEARVDLSRPGLNLLTGERCSRNFTLGPREVAVIEEDA